VYNHYNVHNFGFKVVVCSWGALYTRVKDVEARCRLWSASTLTHC